MKYNQNQFNTVNKQCIVDLDVACFDIPLILKPNQLIKYAWIALYKFYS